MIQVLTLLWEEMTMNLLEKLMSIINKQKQAILFSQKDKEIIREISQCNISYYKTKVLDVLQCELSDWSYDISKYMIKDKNRLIAEKSISVIQEFKRLEDFLNLFEQYQKDEFINYELIEAIGYIGIMRQLDDDIIEKRMKEILQNLEKKGYAKYRIYDYLFYIMMIDYFYIIKLCFDLQNQFNIQELINLRKDEFGTLPKLVQKYLVYIEAIKGHSEKSVLEYASDLRTFFRYMTKLKGLYSFDTDEEKIDLSPIDLEFIQSVKLEDAYEFMIYCKNVRQNNEATRARRVISIRRFYTYLTDNLGVLEKNQLKN